MSRKEKVESAEKENKNTMEKYVGKVEKCVQKIDQNYAKLERLLRSRKFVLADEQKAKIDAYLSERQSQFSATIAGPEKKPGFKL